ncbi:hypothetical protein [Serratia proteamaculans]|uniref:hypothetical protein n=1 Tax=Serratia proteamaculans TaxID=28151 RepID=UPI002177A039|nr:hypothetical protein [Serratia proteamaculans]CAI1096462.1 Uncharacterised protein [Serratia proteamaculans]CAI1131487.1 Uncharacterised protein [Serratia proteamaculans]
MDMNKPLWRRGALVLPLLIATLVLNGCEQRRRSSQTAKNAPETAVELSQAQQEAERLQQCQKELDALHGIDAIGYRKYKQEFERLMSGAAQYAVLRTQVKRDTQETVDALYRYKVNRLCADVNQAVMTGLADRGERLK